MRYGWVMGAAVAVMVAPTAGSAQDFCTVIRGVIRDAERGLEGATIAAEAVSAFRGRLMKAPDLYAEEAAALAQPNEDTFNTRVMFEALIRDLSAMEAARCPALPR